MCGFWGEASQYKVFGFQPEIVPGCCRPYILLCPNLGWVNFGRWVPGRFGRSIPVQYLCFLALNCPGDAVAPTSFYWLHNSQLKVQNSKPIFFPAFGNKEENGTDN